MDGKLHSHLEWPNINCRSRMHLQYILVPLTKLPTIDHSLIQNFNMYHNSFFLATIIIMATPNKLPVSRPPPALCSFCFIINFKYSLIIVHNMRVHAVNRKDLYNFRLCLQYSSHNPMGSDHACAVVFRLYLDGGCSG